MNEFAPALAIAIAAVLLSALVSGAVSAVANVRRMKRSGMLSAEEATRRISEKHRRLSGAWAVASIW